MAEVKKKIVKRIRLNDLVNRIDKVGLELEGGWDTMPKEVLGRMEVDNSVQFAPIEEIVEELDEKGKRLSLKGLDANGRRVPMAYRGELVSNPIPLKTVESIGTWMWRGYPQAVNETCGLHVHMSFLDKMNYQRLMCPEYGAYIISELRKFADEQGLPADHMLRQRLNPEHAWTKQHCEHVYRGDHQVLVGGKDYRSRGKAHSRYTAINYCNMQHGTLECRLLPMFEDVEMAVRAVWVVVNATNRFLSKIRQKERAHEASVKPRGSVFKQINSTVPLRAVRG